MGAGAKGSTKHPGLPQDPSTTSLATGMAGARHHPRSHQHRQRLALLHQHQGDSPQEGPAVTVGRGTVTYTCTLKAQLDLLSKRQMPVFKSKGRSSRFGAFKGYDFSCSANLSWQCGGKSHLCSQKTHC